MVTEAPNWKDKIPWGYVIFGPLAVGLVVMGAGSAMKSREMILLGMFGMVPMLMILFAVVGLTPLVFMRESPTFRGRPGSLALATVLWATAFLGLMYAMNQAN